MRTVHALRGGRGVFGGYLARHLPPLGGLRAFEAAARLMSFRAAAEEIGVTQSAISHQIATLERLLGVKLFERRTRQVRLTAAGELYHPFCRDAFARIARGTELVRQLKGSSTLVVETYATFLVRWLLPRLPRLKKAAPGLPLRFGASQSDWELNLENSDVGIFWTTHPERTGFDVVPLTRADLVPVCIPAVASALGNDPTPAALTALPRLGLHTAPGDWDAWFAAVGTAAPADQITLEFDTHLSAIEAALRGHGVALVPRFLVDDELELGRLCMPVSVAIAQPGGWYIAHRSDQADDPRIAAFVRWLLAEMSVSENRGGEMREGHP